MKKKRSFRKVKKSKAGVPLKYLSGSKIISSNSYDEIIKITRREWLNGDTR